MAAHLQSANHCAWPIDHPAVPKGQGRVRLAFHAANTEAEADSLASLICEFAQAILDEQAAHAKSQAHHMALHHHAAKAMASFGRADWDALLQLKGCVVTGVTELDPAPLVSEQPPTIPERILPLQENHLLAKYLSGGSLTPAETTPGLSAGLTERSNSSMGESMASEDAVPETEGKLRKASFALEAWKRRQQQSAEEEVVVGAKIESKDPAVREILAEMAASVAVGC